MDTCISDDLLRRLHTLELDEPEAARVRRHIESCDQCAQRDAAIVAQHESWIAEFQAAGVPEDAESPAPPPPAPLDPNAIPGYAISGELSVGGQGVVYRATQQATKREVAIKVLRDGAFASRAARRRFEREIELVANLRHSNIVAVFASGHTADGRQYCVMDYVDGAPLTEFVSEHALAPRAILELFAMVCGAVNHAHQRGVIHRDLKPSNILVAADGRPYVLDFGLAKSVGETGGTAVTIDGVVGGTVPYMSPEHARGKGDPLDVRSDVYTLGVILYELITGRLPYPVDGAVFETLRHIAETPPMSPARVVAAHANDSRRLNFVARVDDEIETITLKALSKDPDRRYQSAGELERDIRHYLTGQPIDAKRDSGWYVLRKSLQRYRAAVIVALAFVMIITGSAIALGVMYTQQAAARARAEEQVLIAREARAQEEVQRRKAQRRFNEVRDIARTFIFTLHPLIEGLPGATPAKQLLLQTGLKYLNSLAEDLDPGDVQLKAELGTAYVQLGDLCGNPRGPNLGDPQGALDNYNKGLTLVRGIVESGPAGVEAKRVLGLVHNRIGQVLESLGRQSEARGHYDEALRILERLYAETPNDAEVADALTWNYGESAAEQFAAGDTDGALAMNQEALEISVAMAEANPDDGQLLHNLAAAHSCTAEYLLAVGCAEEGLAAHEESLHELERLVAMRPNNVIYQQSLATACERVGATLQQLGRQEEALSILRRSLEISEIILGADADFDAATRLAVRDRVRIGEAQLALGFPLDAYDTFLAVFDASRQAAEAAPESSAAQREYAVAWYKLGETHRALAQDEQLDVAQRLDHWRQARVWFQGCLDLFIQMRDAGRLWQSDAGVPDEVAADVEACATAAAKLAERLQPPASEPLTDSPTND